MSPDAVLRRMYSLYKSPYIARLINTSPRGGGDVPQESGPPVKPPMPQGGAQGEVPLA